MSEGFKLSYFYLDKYRTIEKAHVSLDHRYIYVQLKSNRSRIEFESPTKRKLAGPYFYGNHIYSMSCIVGKNGEGKTSTIDFIHQSFLLMLKHINDGLLQVDSQSCIIADLDSRRLFYHLEEKTEFLVIFSVRGYDFFLTNIPYIENTLGIKPYTREYKDFIDLDHFCTVYFSQMRYRTDVARSEMRHGRMWYEQDAKRMRQHSDILAGTMITAGDLFSGYEVDLSEERIDAHRSIGENINFDILIQFVFIYLRKDLISKHLGDKFLDYMRVNSINYEGGDYDDDSKLSDAINDNGKVHNLGMINSIVRDPLSYLRPFSSGQYTRFALLARLFWLLEGSKRFSETPFLKIFKDEAEFRTSEMRFFNRMISEHTGALLLFDEGDSFYHPEWQRTFVGDIIDLVEECAGEDIQIVFTTNSPFMMSDMLREDIVTLTREKKDIDEDVLTFGQNIHTLLARRFFLERTIGSVSESVIGWLIQLLSNPGNVCEKQEKDDDTVEKRQSIRTSMEKEGLSAGRAEARYVNRKIYERYKEYCLNRRWGEYSDKCEFLELLISNIGEEIYRNHLSYRFESYRKRISEESVEITTGDAKQLLAMLKSDPRYEGDPNVLVLIEHLQNKVDRG